MTDNSESVVVDLTTYIKQDDESEKFTFRELGSLVNVGTKTYLRFKETQKGEKVASVTIKISDDHIQLTRQDSMGHHSRLIFADKEQHDTIYQTPYGPMNLSVDTKDLLYSYNESPQSGDLLINYELYSGKMMVGEYKMQLHFSA
ncbi:DUF1934 domain-containing protein [Apilactobacillus apisilvae]|uniref:DUF1934 domain-containing protein n=1 Tax=Apilactobacillus apisilvae TaxID=2923364 RepID=A0ABY4PGQ8_9LACO|nr:DUF1934 domain-containing protein [Apilactobacillus apisilvae]UQS84994.1 DUF1934 domain-containing protein [Apilactobacillus apisilvae]